MDQLERIQRVFNSTMIGYIVAPSAQQDLRKALNPPQPLSDYALALPIQANCLERLADTSLPSAARISIHMSERTRVGFAVAQLQAGDLEHRALVPLCTDRGLDWLEWCYRSQSLVYWFEPHDREQVVCIRAEASFSHPKTVLRALSAAPRPSDRVGAQEMFANVLGASVPANLPPPLGRPSSEVVVALVPDSLVPARGGTKP